MMNVFEIYIDKAEKYRFRLKATNGNIILKSQAYTSKASALKGINALKKEGTDISNYKRKDTKNGKHYFVVKAANGKIIGESKKYSSKAGTEMGVNSVIRNVSSQIIEI